MMKKRIFSWFLTLVMVLGMLPMTAWAETESATINMTISDKGEMDTSSEWVIMDMAAYEDLNLDGSKTSAEAKQAYIKKAIESINKESVGETA